MSPGSASRYHRQLGYDMFSFKGMARRCYALILFHDFHALLLYIMRLIRVALFHLSSSGRKGSDLARDLPQVLFLYPLQCIA